MAYDLTPLFLTLKLATMTTLVLLVVGIPLSYWLGFSSSRWKYFIEALVSMPLVLPPTVIGFYLLVALGPRSPLGGWIEQVFDIRLVFSFTGLVIGSVLFSLPFMVNPVKAGFQNIPQAMVDACDTLGKSRLVSLFKVFLPNIRPSLLTGIVMSFAHTVGEFGVVLMIGGNIPNQTQVASIAIFTEVEALNYGAANFYSLVMFAVSFIILFALYWANRNSARSFL
ncbi:MAG: molybdate ABC transporter permease subunit [Candidatus Margulisiibacteriota bacterium]|nr:molybdate ABC transporter permease subunit [Candidatus Margulisiibacteriota bacterium]